MIRSLLSHPTSQMFFDDSVNLKIRISADGGGKVTIVLTSQSEMPGTFRTVLRLLHAPKRQSADHSFLRRAGDAVKKLLNLLGMYLLITDFTFCPADGLHIITEVIDKCG